MDFSCEKPSIEPPCDFAFKMWTRPDCAGTKFENDRYYSNGGRVLNIMGYGETLEDAVDAAYKNINLIDFEDMFFRKDIGSKGLKIIKGIV